jgi:glycosyltransferase involved in cell wall biosynthesis
MKIAYIAMQFPVPGETFISLDVKTLIELKQSVSVLCLRRPHKKIKKMIYERKLQNIVIKHFSFQFILYDIKTFFHKPFIFLYLFAWIFKNCHNQPIHLLKSLLLTAPVLYYFFYISRNNFDIVHLCWGHYPSMLGIMIKRFNPSIVVTQFLVAYDLMEKYAGSVCFSRQADAIITHSKSNISIMIDMGVDTSKILVIYRGTAVDRDSMKDCLEKFNSISSPLFLTASRLVQSKGVDDVIHIFCKVIKLFPLSKLYIAGDGPYKNILENMVEKLKLEQSVVFLGHIPQVELKDFMAKSHFFVLMSRSLGERLPNVVKEAMLQECVVLTTDSLGIDELIDSGNNGIILEAGDVDGAVCKIKDCIMQPDTAVLLAGNARRQIGHKFDVRQSMQLYIRLWTGLYM